MLIIFVFYGLQIVGDEVIDNSNLESSSVALINNISNNLDEELNYENDFSEFQSNLSGNSTFDSEDVFAREFFEGRNEAQEKEGIVARTIKIPDLIILSIGLPQASVAWIRNIVLLVITTILGFALFRAIFGGGKVTET